MSIEPVLRLPNLELPFEVPNDVSNRAFGGRTSCGVCEQEAQ